MSFYQANTDGSIMIDSEPDGPSTSKIKAILEQSLSLNNWSVNWTEQSSQPYKAELSAGDVNIQLFIYCWRVSNGGRPNRLEEKRIQIGSNVADTGFQVENSRSEKCLLLGIYERNGTPIITAWEAEKNRNHGSSKSCFISVKAIAIAMRDGFAQHVDNNGNVVCAFRQEFLHFYVMNMHKLHNKNIALIDDEGNLNYSLINEDNIENTYQVNVVSDIPENQVDDNIPRNIIIYGAPGTGKSYELNQRVESSFPHESLRTRVTFYPQYSYGQFVGTYKPTPLYQETDKLIYEPDMITESSHQKEPLIDYRFIPGPFLETLCKSLKNPRNNYCLVIEEINRTNVASTFGDAFQLLDRDSSGDSVYSISFNADIMNYLKQQGISKDEIKLPRNMFIWATMNSADQGVLPMDTAFKRRWTFEYLPLNQHEDSTDGWEITLKFLSAPIKWNWFRTVINNELKSFGVAEDKLLGPFFLKAHELANGDVFKNKLLLYLRDDVLRHNASKLFKKQTFSDIVEEYDKGNEIFTIGKDKFLRVSSDESQN